MTEIENIKLFFSNAVVKDCVSVKKIEEKANLPASCLHKFLKGAPYRYLTPEQIDRLVPVIVNIGYRPVDSDSQFL